MKKPSISALLIGLIPFIGICFSVPLWNKATPVILGFPFNLFWLVAWILATPGIMSIALWLEKRR